MLFHRNFLVLAIIIFSGLSTFMTTAKSSNTVDFNEVTLTSPYTLTQDIIVADLLANPGKELITFSVDEQANRWLMIYQYDAANNQYVIAQQTVIPKYFYRFDLSEYRQEQLQQLYFLSSDSLAVYVTQSQAQNKAKPELNAHTKLDISVSKSEKFRSIADIDSLYIHSQADFISRGHFIKDLNTDGVDDVIIADFTETHLLIGQVQGGFILQSLSIKPNVQVLSSGISYMPRQLYFSDANLDGKHDILMVGEGEMIIYLQRENNQFIEQGVHLPINNMISGIEWWNKRDESGNKLDQSNLEYRMLEDLRDINADGLIDMVVRYTKASGVLDRVNDYEIFLGKFSDKGKQTKSQRITLTYNKEADSVIRADGTLTGIEFIDIDNDNKQEVLLAGFDIGLSQIITALLTGAIDQDVYVFKMDKDGQFTAKPIIQKTVELTFSLTSGKSGNPIVKVADLTGDGLKELILSDDDDELKIYLGKQSAEYSNKSNQLFEKRSVSYDTTLPKDGKFVIIDDLNGDGKDDLVMQFSHLDSEEQRKTFKVLFAN